MKFTYSIPTKILFGPGSFNDLATTPLPGKKALVVITAGYFPAYRTGSRGHYKENRFAWLS